MKIYTKTFQINNDVKITFKELFSYNITKIPNFEKIYV